MTQPYPPLYPIGIPGQPWQLEEKQQWLAQQRWQRSYMHEVVRPLRELLAQSELCDVLVLEQYGELTYKSIGYDDYPLYVVRSALWDATKPIVLVTGGVHGYETSGVQGALAFIAQHAKRYVGERDVGEGAVANLLIFPCISPWGYETINRWNPAAVDPNRSFSLASDCAETKPVLEFLAPYLSQVLVHIDLHETTDSDNSEFRPAKAARDGVVNHNWNIPDGFYVVGDTAKPTPAFQAAIIDAVAKVTVIAPADDAGCLIGEPLQQPGVIHYDKQALKLCGGMTAAPFVTTTEVYPDSPRTDPAQCNAAQVAAIVAAFDFALSQASAVSVLLPQDTALLDKDESVS